MQTYRSIPPLNDLEQDRFWSKVDRQSVADCWNWTGGYGQHGYGICHISRRQFIAHRVAYTPALGPIPDGLVLDHLCRNPKCVNPKHLEPVTQRENVRRSSAKSTINANKTRCLNGHPFDAENTVIRQGKYGMQRSCRQCRADQQRERRQAALVEPDEVRYSAGEYERTRSRIPYGSVCKHGHLLTTESVAIRRSYSGFAWACKRCDVEKSQRYQKRQHTDAAQHRDLAERMGELLG